MGLKNKDLSILFLGTLVPDIKEFHNPAFVRSGNMVQEGIVEGFYRQNIKTRVISSQAIPTYPLYKKIFFKKKRIKNYKDIDLTIMPKFNILFLRELFTDIYVFFSILLWAYKNRNFKRTILVYNIYSPSIPLTYFVGKITKSKVVSIIYDIGMPPKTLKLGFIRRSIYYVFEFLAKLFIPQLDGRIVITEAIAEKYAPNMHYLLLDGGISNNIVNRLFPLELKDDQSDTVFLCSGSLWTGNGVDLLLDTLKINPNPNIKVYFAGRGDREDIIKMAEKQDSRIVYKGMLDLDELFELYRKSDILLNLRVIPNEEGKYWFPSKFLEYLAIGKPTISTSAVHIQKEYGHLCIILENISPQSLSDLINEVIKMPIEEKFKIGKMARRFALENFTWDNRSKSISKYINDVVWS